MTDNSDRPTVQLSLSCCYYVINRNFDGNVYEVCNNEFAVKYRILREESDAKFLLYHEGPQPADMDNWLLDVLLAHGEFRTDQASIYLGELGLGPEYSELVQDHLEFFNAVKRRDGLKKLLQNNESHGAVRIKMLAVCSEEALLHI